MLSIEQIENIIKSKYKDVESCLSTESGELIFDINKTKCYSGYFIKFKKILLLNTEEKNKISYQEMMKTDFELYNYDETYKKFEIENNTIELKHLLNIKITQQDMIDWLLSIGFKNNDNYYYLDMENHYLVYCENKLYQNYTDIECFGIEVFKATNSNEYWRLYNIIKNLKG